MGEEMDHKYGSEFSSKKTWAYAKSCWKKIKKGRAQGSSWPGLPPTPSRTRCFFITSSMFLSFPHTSGHLRNFTLSNGQHILMAFVPLNNCPSILYKQAFDLLLYSYFQLGVSLIPSWSLSLDNPDPECQNVPGRVCLPHLLCIYLLLETSSLLLRCSHLGWPDIRATLLSSGELSFCYTMCPYFSFPQDLP